MEFSTGDKNANSEPTELKKKCVMILQGSCVEFFCKLESQRYVNETSAHPFSISV
jgi:hypothetical protein